MRPFCHFQYSFRSSQSTADLLTVAPDRIARAFSRFGATGAVALDISKALAGFGMLVIFLKLCIHCNKSKTQQIKGINS